MKTKVSNLSPRQYEQLREIIAVIVKVIHPEKIICYGARTKSLETWGCFIHTTEPQIHTVFDLLIITRKNEKKNSHEILDRIGYCNTAVITIIALVHNITAVNAALKNRNAFFITLYKTGVLLYDNNDVPLFTSFEKPDETDQILKSMTQWNKWFCQGQQFLKGASYFSSAGWNDLSVFMLHQAVEHTCIALVGACTGYRPATHNLGRLLAMTENFSPHLSAVFPKNTREEMDLFNTLAKAYSDARYSEGFKARSETVIVLIERVTALQCQSEKLYRNKLWEMKNGSALYTSHHLQNCLTYENC